VNGDINNKGSLKNKQKRSHKYLVQPNPTYIYGKRIKSLLYYGTRDLPLPLESHKLTRVLSL